MTPVTELVPVLAGLPERSWRRIAAQMSWVYRYKALGYDRQMPDYCTQIIGKMPTVERWAATVKAVAAARRKAKHAAEVARKRAAKHTKREYMRNYMRARRAQAKENQA